MAKVTLRQKPMSDKRQSLFLDYYPPIKNPETGKLIRKEYLKLFIFDKPKSEFDKRHNKETLFLAESIKAQRQLEIQQQQYGFISDKQRNGDFVEYFKTLAKKRNGSNSGNWASALYYLEGFTGGTLRFSEIDVRLCNDFKEYLAKTPTNKSKNLLLSQNSCVSYFNKFKHCLKQAYKDGLLKSDINAKVESIKTAETEKQHLTLEELQKLVSTDSKYPVLKQAALFSALTGLRFSDIAKLKWSEVQYSELQGGYLIQFKQQKTKGVEVLPIGLDAYSLLGERAEPDTLVFQDLDYSKHVAAYLKDWVKASGITKQITFHCFRHTFATLQLSYGTDLYTV
ncbi:MAG: tyrosine-type recombinase/integrase, partial [Sphingobacteriaceae bacterium]